MSKLIRLPEVIARTGLSRSRVYQLMSDGKFPRPVQHSPRVNTWPEAEISDWIASRIAAREAA